MKHIPLKSLAWLVITLFTLLVMVMAWQSTRFRVDASADTLLMKDNIKYLQTQLAAERYNPDEFILVAYQPSDNNIFSAQTLNTVAEISNKLEQIERVSRVRSLVNVPVFTQVDGLADIDPSQLTWESQQYTPQTLEAALSDHPLYMGLLINEELTALSIQIVFQANEELARVQSNIVEIKQNQMERELTDNEKEQLNELQNQQDELQRDLNIIRAEEIESIRQILSPYRDQGAFYLGGGNLLANQLINIIKSDLLLFGTVIAVLVTLVLIYLFRSFFWVLMPLLCCGVSVLSTLGLLGMLGLKVTVISANVIALQIILTLAVIIHLIVQYQELQEDSSHDHNRLVLATIKEKAKPCFYAGLTTSVGFASLIFSGIQPVISFGWMMMIAVIITLVVSLVLFPACMIAWRDKKQKLVRHSLIKRGMLACAALCSRRPRLIVISGIIVLAAGIAGCFRLTAENSFIDYFSEDTDVYRELSYIDKNFGGSTPFDILLNIPPEYIEEDLLITAESVQLTEEVQQKLEAEEAIGNITSIADFTRIASVVSGKPLTEYEVTALYRSLDAELRDDLVKPYFDQDTQQLRISTRVQDTTEGLDRAELMVRIHEKLRSSGLSEDQYQLTNLFVLYQDILDRLVASQFTTLALVYAAMAIVMLAIFRSIKIAAICLIPNVITTAVIFGVMGLAGIPLDLMTLTIAAVAMGISVDDTIHYVHRYLKERKHNADPVKQTHQTVGYALLYTTTVIVLGFSCLMVSDFVPSILFGLLTSIAMLVALITDISLLPVLLARFLPYRQSEPKDA